MRFRFVPAKRAANLKKHGLDLADARQVVESGQTVTFEDKRFHFDAQGRHEQAIYRENLT